MRYRLLIYLLTPLALAFMWWRGRKEPAWREGWAQRWVARRNAGGGERWGARRITISE